MVEWTERSLSNAIDIKSYVKRKFGQKEVRKFELLLQGFETTISNFPNLYPRSNRQEILRRAVIHKNTTIYYAIENDVITVIAMKDARQNKP